MSDEIVRENPDNVKVKEEVGNLTDSVKETIADLMYRAWKHIMLSVETDINVKRSIRFMESHMFAFAGYIGCNAKDTDDILKIYKDKMNSEYGRKSDAK